MQVQLEHPALSVPIHVPIPVTVPAADGSSHVAAPYTDANDRLRHRHNIEQLAQETGAPVAVLEPIYERILARLKLDATIQDYLPVLVAKSVKNVLKDIARRH